MKRRSFVTAAFAVSLLAAVITGQTSGVFSQEEGIQAPSLEPTKLLRYPDVFENQVVFCYAGDIWKSDFDGENVIRLTAHEGLEEFPKFSPDGSMIAFTESI